MVVVKTIFYDILQAFSMNYNNKKEYLYIDITILTLLIVKKSRKNNTLVKIHTGVA